MTNEFKGRTGVDRMVRATASSASGLQMAYVGETAFRQEVWIAAVLIPSAFLLGQDWVQIALLAGSVMLVLITELLNSGIEAVVDRISYDWHELSKRAKDFGSAAVMLSLLVCGAIWAVALFQRFAGA